MASFCISSPVDDGRVPICCNYSHLHKWPDSDYEFVKSRKSAAANLPNKGRGSMFGQARVTDGYSYRQLYLRSYTFTREEDTKEKVISWLGRIGDHIRLGLRKVNKGPRSALKAVVRACREHASTTVMQKRIYEAQADLLMDVLEKYGYTFDWLYPE